MVDKNFLDTWQANWVEIKKIFKIVGVEMDVQMLSK